MNIFPLFIVALSLIGFSIAAYIFRRKRAEEHLICPLNGDCDSVVRSEYAFFFTIPVEVWGMLYYAALAFAYSVLVYFPALASPFVIFVLLGVTITAFLFSLYLTFIQAFALHEWCTWCLFSAGLCTLILLFAFLGLPFGLSPLLAENHDFIFALHLLAVALGIGGATIADVFFFKFLKDFRISKTEAAVLHTLSQVIWFALGFIVLTGVGLYIPAAVILNMSPKFLGKMVIVGVLIANGAFLNLLVSPKLVRISFGGKHEHKPNELRRLRKLAFALGAISITSWYSAFMLALWRDVPFLFAEILLGYGLVLCVAVAMSQFFEHRFAMVADDWQE